jgi:hypothetical protein
MSSASGALTPAGWKRDSMNTAATATERAAVLVEDAAWIRVMGFPVLELEGSVSTGYSIDPGGATERARRSRVAPLALRTGPGGWFAEGLGQMNSRTAEPAPSFAGCCSGGPGPHGQARPAERAGVQPEQLPVRQEEFAVAVAAPARGFCS